MYTCETYYLVSLRTLLGTRASIWKNSVYAQRSVVHKLGTAGFCVSVKRDDRQVEALYAMRHNQNPQTGKEALST